MPTLAFRPDTSQGRRQSAVCSGLALEGSVIQGRRQLHNCYAMLQSGLGLATALLEGFGFGIPSMEVPTSMPSRASGAKIVLTHGGRFGHSKMPLLSLGWPW